MKDKCTEKQRIYDKRLSTLFKGGSRGILHWVCAVKSPPRPLSRHLRVVRKEGGRALMGNFPWALLSDGVAASMTSFRTSEARSGLCPLGRNQYDDDWFPAFAGTTSGYAFRRYEHVMMKGLIALFILLAAILTVRDAQSAPPSRIVSLAPSITEILFDLGAGDRVAAVTDFCDYPAEARRKPKVGGFANPSLEAIVAVRPDLVMMTEEGNPVDLYKRLGALGIKTYVFRARRLRELPQGIRDLGVALGMPDAAAKRATLVEKKMDALAKKSKSAESGRAPLTALFVIHPEPLLVAGRETIIDDALTLLNVENIAAGAGTKYPKYTIEEIVRRSPDVIFIGQGPMSANLSKSLMKRLDTLEAVRKGRVYYVSELLYRLTPRTMDGIEELNGHLRGL